MTIDTDSLLSYVDMLALAGRDTALRHVASTNGGEYAGPCPFCGGRDRFRVQPNASPRPIWYCRQCGGGRWHDALDYVARRESLDLKRADDFRRACELLGGAAEALPHRERPPAPPAPDAGPPSVDWQAAVRHVIDETVTALWSAAGDRARAWLHARGLNDVTLQRWRIGYCAGSGYRDIAGLSVPCGIVIPCEIAGNIWYLKVRRASGEPKYIHVKGGRPALFGADTLRGHSVAVICEGEFDAMLLHQQAGELCGIATLGAAGKSLDVSRWGEYLLPLRRLLLAYDADSAGRAGADKLAGLTARARRVSLPAMPGIKDLTDFHLAGGNLRAWLTFELARHGARPSMSVDMPRPLASTPPPPADALRPVPALPADVPALPAADGASTLLPPDDDPGLLDAITAEAPAMEDGELLGPDAPAHTAPMLAHGPRRITGVYTADQVRGLPGGLLSLEVNPPDVLRAIGGALDVRYLVTWIEMPALAEAVPA